ncbi:Fis family transcriptional regulator [Achromobacter xylosoxidans]|nr:Fis family transcriptional regulator [Achromobacter xylosoxidans]
MKTCELSRYVSYDPATGILTRKVTLAGNAKAGQQITGKNSSGYIQCVINTKFYYGHRLAWQLHYGEPPNGIVDHINGNKSDNRISNLRIASSLGNVHNAALRKDNKSGVKGVFWDATRGRWRASVSLAGREVFSQIFESKEDAILAVRAARKQLHGSFANHGS